MTPSRSEDKVLESLDGSAGSKFAERDDDSSDWVRSNKAHRDISDVTQTLAKSCLKLFLYGRNLSQNFVSDVDGSGAAQHNRT